MLGAASERERANLSAFARRGYALPMADAKQGSPERWAVTRRWRRLSSDEPESPPAATADLAAHDTLALLGSAGSGKTHEARLLMSLERVGGRKVVWRRLAECVTTAGDLERELAGLKASLTDGCSVYLDALDEAMIPVRPAWELVAKWISKECSGRGLKLRVTCRPAVWQQAVEVALAGTRPGGEHGVFQLLPMDADDILAAASAHALDAGAFLRAAGSRRVAPLAENPLTLRMLLRLFAESGDLPGSLAELYKLAIASLASDPRERLERGTQLQSPPERLVRAAGLVSLYATLSGRLEVSLADDPPAGQLGRLEILDPDGGGQPIDPGLLRELSQCGLCTATAPRSFAFIHRQLVEYLAASFLSRLPAHQARSCLASGLGWRRGVAGPMRETAAFLATMSNDIARWIVECDPEVVGLSELADHGLREAAFGGLLARARGGELTDAAIRRDVAVNGFRCPGVESMAVAALSERGDAAEHVVELGLSCVEEWDLSGRSRELADLVLDPSAPMRCRSTAGHLLRRLGNADAKARLLPLARGEPGDEHHDLIGHAVACNWPERLGARQVLDALGRDRGNVVGSYESMLWHLEERGFCAADDLAAGLLWARGAHSAVGQHDAEHRIAIRIAHEAFGRLDEPGVLGDLTDLLVAWQGGAHSFPLVALERSPPGAGGDALRPSPLPANPDARRALIAELVRHPRGGRAGVHWICNRLAQVEDFGWLLSQAASPENPMDRREAFARIADWVDWPPSRECRRLWRRHRRTEPIGRTLGGRVPENGWQWAVRLLRRWRHRVHQAFHARRHRPRRLRPSRAALLGAAVKRSEAGDADAFVDVADLLVMDEFGRYRDSWRLLTDGDAWASASGRLRGRVLRAAERFLLDGAAHVDHALSLPDGTSVAGGIQGLLLVCDLDPGWLRRRPAEWWDLWAPYICRDLHFNTSGEPDDSKERLYLIAWELAGGRVTEHLVREARREAAAGHTVRELLQRSPDSLNAGLRERLLDELIAGRVGAGAAGPCAEFLCCRDPAALDTLLVHLRASADEWSDTRRRVLAEAFLSDASRSWGTLAALCAARPGEAREVLALIAHDDRLRGPHAARRPLDGLTVDELRQLAEALLGAFPPEADPRRRGAYAVRPADSAAFLRDELIRHLGGRSDAEAVSALELLESAFGGRYLWLRRARVGAARAWREAQWSPLPPSLVARLAASAEHRLVLSAEDLREGVAFAARRFGDWLLRDGRAMVEALWNTGPPRPSPKPENFVSECLANELRSYLRESCVTASREAEVHRRKLPKRLGGAAGSEIDILVQVPAPGAGSGRPLQLPVEVKLSCNAEADSSIQGQLADRYLPELGVLDGVFVLVWMSLENPAGLSEAHRPLWPSIECATRELSNQAAALEELRGVRIEVVVLDATLQ